MNVKGAIIFLLLIVSITMAYAQPYASNNGKFEVDQIKGCAPLTINFSERPGFPCTGGPLCDMDYDIDDTVPFQQGDFTHTYTQAGTYKFVVLYQTLGRDTVTITVLPNIQPAFDIYSCSGNGAQIKVTDTNYDQYVINYSDGAPPQTIVPSGSFARDTHSFLGSGNKTITVRGRNLGADDNCDATNQNFNALAILTPPTITQLTVLDDQNIQLDYNNSTNVLYKLEIATNGTSFQQFRDVYNTNTTNVTGLRTETIYYCFRLGAFDPCNNTTTYSNVICSADFDATAQNNVDKLTWRTSATGISNYSISKSTGGSFSSPAASTSFDDTDVRCGTEYCYQLTSVYANGSQSISLQKCVTAISTDIPTAPQDVSASVNTNNNAVDLQWSQDPAFTAGTYSIFKGGNLIGTSNTPTFSDASYSVDVPACYTISYADVCGNKSVQSLQACPVTLSGSLRDNNVIDLNWSAYVGWKNGVDHYIVEKFSDQGQLVETFDVAGATVFMDDKEDNTNQINLYRVTAFPVDAGLTPATSNTITLIKDPNIFHPTAFTPNGDGLNDLFKVFGQFTAQVEFKIFNRWGELLFITTDLDKGWDGTFKGNASPEGTYVFRAYLTDLAGRTSERSGTILLLRKR